jgi:hypothetical protein
MYTYFQAERAVTTRLPACVEDHQNATQRLAAAMQNCSRQKKKDIRFWKAVLVEGTCFP